MHKCLVPAHIKGKPPSYYIIAGFVFSIVSVPYLHSEYGKDSNYDAPVKLLDKLLHSMAQTEDEQLVVLSQVLVADINIGYEDTVNTQVLAFNGVQVRNLRHLAEMVESYEDEFLQFSLDYQQIVVLGMPDTGGQIVYILDQVRALENEMLLRIKQQKLVITPEILVN